ncbi:MAG: glucokinase [Thermoanaerobaculia bacterium]
MAGGRGPTAPVWPCLGRAGAVGARGGVYLAGGVLPRLAEAFDDERFRTRFLAKGRFRTYLEPVPVDLIVSEEAALLGAVNHLIGLGNSTTMREGTR